MRSIPVIVVFAAVLLCASPAQAQQIQDKTTLSTPMQVIIDKQRDYIRQMARDDARAAKASASTGLAIRGKGCTSTRVVAGAVIGAAGGFIAGSIINHDSEGSFVHVGTAGYVTLAAIGSGIGAVVGYATCR